MLEKRFSENDKQLKALTSAGNELETIAFRVEELSSDKVSRIRNNVKYIINFDKPLRIAF